MILTVDEGQTFEFAPADRRHIAAMLRGDVEWREHGAAIWNVVGHVALPSGTTLIIRSAKAPLACLLAWSAYVDPALRDLQHLKSLPASGDQGDVGAALARLFCDELDAIVAAHGVRRRYHRIRTRSSTVRGAIDFATLSRSGGDLSRLPCIVWERLPGTPLNRLLAAAIQRIARNPLMRSAVGGRLHRVHAAFADVVPAIDPLLLVGRRPLARDELPYSAACCLARLLLRGLGLSTGSDALGLGFLVRVDALFERAVVRALDDAGFAGVAKHSVHYARVDRTAKKTTAGPMQLDYFIPDPVSAVVVDAKYKRRVSPDNLQQMVTYCHLTGARRAVLVFPRGQLGDLRSYVLPGTANNEVRVDISEFDTSGRTVAEWRRHGAAFASSME